jgi:proteasome lid subunit RPN8/RPN11
MFDSILQWVLPSFGEPVAISEQLLDSCFKACKGSDPDEFLCLLGGEKGMYEFEDSEVLLTDFYMIPGTTSNSTSATLREDLVPSGMRLYGSLHSHPNGTARPSRQDMEMFSRYPVNIIVGSPYNMSSWQAYDRSSEPTSLEVFDESRY